ncbi:hypothetical protein AMECASPLE_035541 [Ameca splendens]|uniref:Uncharacterized protein n=1 Tax=Ameca splendens TaxID=208324 RepID=A0ABV0XKG9_9TELE
MTSNQEDKHNNKTQTIRLESAPYVEKDKRNCWLFPHKTLASKDRDGGTLQMIQKRTQAADKLRFKQVQPMSLKGLWFQIGYRIPAAVSAQKTERTWSLDSSSLAVPSLRLPHILDKTFLHLEGFFNSSDSESFLLSRLKTLVFLTIETWDITARLLRGRELTTSVCLPPKKSTCYHLKDSSDSQHYGRLG